MRPHLYRVFLLCISFTNVLTDQIEYAQYEAQTTTNMEFIESSGSASPSISGDGEGSGGITKTPSRESVWYTTNSLLIELEEKQTTDIVAVDDNSTKAFFVISTTPSNSTISFSQGVQQETSFQAFTGSDVDQSAVTTKSLITDHERSVAVTQDIEKENMNSSYQATTVKTTPENSSIPNSSAFVRFLSTVSLFEEVENDTKSVSNNPKGGTPNPSNSTIAANKMESTTPSLFVKEQEETTNSDLDFPSTFFEFSTRSPDHNPNEAQICGKFICGVGYSCVKNRCLSACDSTHPYCQNRGICNVLPNGKPACWCPSSSEWWFRGERCEIGESNLKVALIAGGLSFIVLTLFIVVIICMSRLVVQSKMKDQILEGKLIRTSTLRSNVTRNDRAFLNSSDLLTPVPPTFDTSSQEEETQHTNTGTSSVQYWKLGTITKDGEARTRFTTKNQADIESVDRRVSATSFRRICTGERREPKSRPESMTQPRERNRTEVQYETSGIIL